MSKGKADVWILEFAGPIPTRAYYLTRAEGVRARSRMRKKGFHVQLFKVEQPQEETHAETRSPESRRDNNKFISRLTDRFRRRNRNKG